MILIADSGSTKCDWLLIDKSGEHLGEYKTMGLNPYFHSAEVVESTLRDNAELLKLADKVEHVFFYGAGASTPNLMNIMTSGINAVFTNAQVVVDHDLVGAAYAAYDGEPCIAAILGTGSNSCFFDGNEVREEVPALAYILGDEGSGSWFGKQLLREYFYKQLPQDLRCSFEQEFNVSKDDLVEKVYNNRHANVWLAAFMRFVGKHNDHPHVQNWVTDGIREFVKVHIKCFPEHTSVTTHFIGSIGYYFNDVLTRVCKEEGVILGEVIKKPIHRLAQFHVDYLIPQLQGS
ncbi:BadF/BadG/BcrA/BcrD ATPase family protein [Sanyastnella coralliicola]|uniref:BadF/BadG/BcrA/BcrD ATPase family protein n=1 Tax=Sanyastnella coralliicola TaxID=3069118 RepID=UPI0027BAD537|nr:BadF/BadG/BcrA/BcrD ATPase family protein [Longitalea sp. SCSIO 12813]